MFLGLTRLILLSAIAVASTEAEGFEMGPRFGYGGGVGILQILHVDASYWANNDESMDISLSPMFVMNSASLGFTRHLKFRESEGTRHNFLFNGTGSYFVGKSPIMPRFTFGPGVGYGYLTNTVDLRFTTNHYIGSLDYLGATFLEQLSYFPEFRITYQRRVP